MSFVTTDELTIINAGWKYRTQISRGGYLFLRYSNKVVNGLWKITMAQEQPPAFAGFIMTTQACASSFAYEQTWSYEKRYNTDGDGIHDNAWSLIDAWKESIAPEPEPEPEEEEEENPIDEGNGILDDIKNKFENWITQAILAGLAFLEAPINLIKEMVAKLGQTISGIVDAVKSAISTVMAKVVGMFDIVIQKIKGVIDKVWENIELVWMTLKDMFNTVKNAIVIAFEKSWEFIKKTFITLWTKMKEGLTYIGNAIVEGLKYLWDKIKDAIDWVWKILNNAYTAIVDTVTAIWDRFKEKLTATIDSIKEGFLEAIEYLAWYFENFWELHKKELLNLEDWSEERLVELGTFIIKTQKKIADRLIKEGGLK